MRIRKFIINMFFFALVGALCGHRYYDWHYWVIMVGMVGVYVNNSIDD